MAVLPRLSARSLLDDLSRASAAVGALIANVGLGQWSAPTPCTDWTVRQVVHHLVGMNRVFTSLLVGEPPPRRDPDVVDDDPVTSYVDTAAALQSAFAAPGVLARTFQGPLGTATGADRLQIRLYDLLAHGWDLAFATGQSPALPDDVAEHALAFARTQLTDQARPGRFAPAQAVDDNAFAIERLVAFLGRPMPHRHDQSPRSGT